ncbi:hypothetical protein KUTeg_012276, partial [Tegillarca granosa]
MNFLEGIQRYYSLSMASTKTRGDFENYIVRLRKLPKQIIQRQSGSGITVKQFFDSLVNDIRAMTYDGPGGGYTSATETKPGYFSANVLRPMEVPSFDFMALALHEANPGHHLQHSYGMKATLPDYRKQPEISFYDVPFWFPFYSAYMELQIIVKSNGKCTESRVNNSDKKVFLEFHVFYTYKNEDYINMCIICMNLSMFCIFKGWALYSEYLGVEMGLYKDDFEMWERERAIDFMLNYTASSRESATTEIDRYITWPGQACAYKIGEMKIKDMRVKAQNELGSKFDIRDFHLVILENGAVPMSVLETLINEWVDKKKNEPGPGPSSSSTTITLSSCLSIQLSIQPVLLENKTYQIRFTSRDRKKKR